MTADTSGPTRPPEPGSLADALIDGEMAAEERYALADQLADAPDLAAQTMADLRLTEGLRLTLGAVDTPPPSALAAEARRLGRALQWQALRRRAMPLVAGAACFVLGWSGQSLLDSLSPAPAGSTVTPLIEAALDAEATLALRQAMQSQPESPSLDTGEIEHTLGITLPGLPQDWLVRDVQVVATMARPGVAIAIETPDMGEIMLFTVAQSGQVQDHAPRAYRRDGKAFAVFARDDASYVLVDNSAPLADLSRGAEHLLRRFN